MYTVHHGAGVGDLQFTVVVHVGAQQLRDVAACGKRGRGLMAAQIVDILRVVDVHGPLPLASPYRSTVVCPVLPTVIRLAASSAAAAVLDAPSAR